MKIITGTTGSPHITPAQDAMWHRAKDVIKTFVFDEGECFDPEIMSNTIVRVKSGICSIQGRYMCIELGTYDEVTLENGSQGMKRKDLIYGKLAISDGGISTATLEVLKGVPTEGDPVLPTLPDTDLDEGDSEAYIPLVEVDIDGITIVDANMIANMFDLVIPDDLLEAELTAVLGDISYGTPSNEMLQMVEQIKADEADRLSSMVSIEEPVEEEVIDEEIVEEESEVSE